MRSPLAVAALTASLLAALGTSLGSLVIGRLAEQPGWPLVRILAVVVIGGAVCDAVGRTIWAGLVDRAEGRLRGDLLDVALSQPLSALSEQAVGEILDRLDDDTHEVGALLRRDVWQAIRTALATGPLWVIAGLTWWPSAVLLPVTGLAAAVSVRRLLPEISKRTVIEEAAWSEQAAALEEGVAAADDLRTSDGQAFVIRRNAEMIARIHELFERVLRVEFATSMRSGMLLNALLAGTAIVGVSLAVTDHLRIGELVTLYAVTTTFVGQVEQLARHLPNLQAGFGAVLRLRALQAAPAEPEDGGDLPEGDLTVVFTDLTFSYAPGGFSLHDVTMTVPAATTTALVGRSGSGKSTLVSLLSRAIDPPRGSLAVNGVDVLDLKLTSLRAAVGVVTQRTEILAGTLAENISLFADLPRARIEAAVDQLGLTDWVAGLPQGLDTLLGPGGSTLSAGEEQLVAFARLLVRDVRVVVLDEATARMDSLTESRVVAASQRLLAGRTGLLVAHRLSTAERADAVAVLDGGQVIQQGPRAELALAPGPFADLLAAAGATEATSVDAQAVAPASLRGGVGTIRHAQTPPPPRRLRPILGLARSTVKALLVQPRWGLAGAVLFILHMVAGAFGALTGWLWGHLVASLGTGDRPAAIPALTAGVAVMILVAPVGIAYAMRLYPRWWIEVMLRVRMSVLAGRTAQRALSKAPPGEVVARAMDAERLALYADRWVDVASGLFAAAVTGLLAWNILASGVLLGVMAAAALVSVLGVRVAGRSAARSSAARAAFGQALVSAVESVRTVKLAAATDDVHAHLRRVDSGRVDAAVREHRVQALLDGVPGVMVQVGVVTAWAAAAYGSWGLATALLVSSAVSGFDWFGRVAGAAVTEAPGTRSWLRATSALAGGGDLMALPASVNLVSGTAPGPASPAQLTEPLRQLRVTGLSAIHEDGTLGVRRVNLAVAPGEFVLLLGRVGSGKSSLLAALAGLVHCTGEITWNGRPVQDPELELRPPRVAYVAQVPRVLSGTFADNVRLDHPERQVLPALVAAGLERDVAEVGGPDALVGHRGVRLSGGQIQRLAIARALACEAQILLADDVSSALDAATEVHLWATLRSRGMTVIGATSKAAALAQADRVLVLDEGQVVDEGTWQDLAPRWAAMAG